MVCVNSKHKVNIYINHGCYFQGQYVFIHDALNELIMCGETEIAATNLRTAINHLSTQTEGKEITGFEHQFQVWTRLHLL